MSHVVAQKTKKGEPLFSDLSCLREACQFLGLQVVETNVYHWYGTHVGDYPLPEGMRAQDLGKNALFVLRATAEAKKQANVSEPYDIGVLADPNNPGCYTLIYDFWANGRGIDQLVGPPVVEPDRSVSMICPWLKQAYDMVCEKRSAAEVGDEMWMGTLAQAREKFPEEFAGVPKQADEAKTYTSVTRTRERLGV